MGNEDWSSNIMGGDTGIDADDPLLFIVDMCPECGSEKNVWRNSSDELQCDNCGYSEESDEDETWEDDDD